MNEEFFVYNESLNSWIIDPFGRGPYCILDTRIETPEKLLGWASHLSEKTWADSQLIGAFIDDVCARKGWKHRPI